MSETTKLRNENSALDIRALDEQSFASHVDRYRRELHVHCYRMLGSFEDAEDAVQEALIRAWRHRNTFQLRSSLRAWLYRIATNASLDLIARLRPKRVSGEEVLWLQPYPDHLLDELAADADGSPESMAVEQETIDLAYLVALQHLAPRARAVLILRDVHGWSARDVANLLESTVPSVNSALQRARAGMREHLPADRQFWSGSANDANRELVSQYTELAAAADVSGLATLLREDVRTSMPPTPGTVIGMHAVVTDWIESGFAGMTGLRAVSTSVNRQPAIAFYLWDASERAYLPLTLDVLRITGDRIAEITTFHSDQFQRLNLPDRLTEGEQL